MSLPVPPSIESGQLAFDPVNGIVYYKDKDNNLISTSLNWTKTDSDATNATDGITIDNNLTVAGNLVVGGDTISLNVSQILVEDNILILNSNVTGSPSLNAGIEIERGNSTNVSIIWNETTDKWQYTNNGVNFYNLISSNDVTAFTSLPSLVTVGTISSGTWNGTAIAGQYGGTGVANTGKTLTISGNTVIGSSTHTVTLTTSGNTSIALPTTGTLITSTVTSLSSLATVGTITSGTWNGTAIAGQYGGTGVANTGKTITVSGNTTIGSSTHTVAFVTSGNTSVTLPTSGTLVNSSVTSLSSLATVGTITSGTWNGTAIALGYGGTGKTTAPAAMAALMGYTSTATAGATTTLTNTSSYYQQFTGSSNQTVQLPVTSTLQTGWTFHIVNNSTGTLTINSSGGNAVTTVPSQTTAMVTCIGTTLTTAADWESGLTDFSNYTGSGSVVMGTSPAITTSLTTGSASFDLINTTATTVNFAGAGTSIAIGASSGTFTVNNVTIAHPNATSMTMNGTSPSITTTSTGTASVFNTNALTGNIFGAATAVSIGATTGTTTINNGLVLKQTLEAVTIDASTALSATRTQIDTLTSSIYYFSGTPSADFTLNIRGNSTVTDLNTIMATGQTLTVTIIVDRSANTKKLSVIEINQVSQTISWFGGSAPSTGNALDIYSITILKTAASTYKVFASQSKFG